MMIVVGVERRLLSEREACLEGWWVTETKNIGGKDSIVGGLGSQSNREFCKKGEIIV